MAVGVASINWLAFESGFNQYRLDKESQAIKPIVALVQSAYLNEFDNKFG